MTIPRFSAFGSTLRARQRPHAVAAFPGPRRVLVIDDSRMTQLFAKRLLESAGSLVEFANDGRAGVRIADAKPFDLILVALTMRHVDGWQTAAMLRACGRRMPIIALTTESDPQHRRVWREAGFNGLLKKPFTIDEFLSAWEALRTDRPATQVCDAGANAGIG